ncbi:MAG: hypothetical protein M3461_06730 [Pseudomonadota bacterium]|nr:hypothetical protein [Pseudomonadota bacterium]
MKFLTRNGFLIEEQGMTYLADTDPDLALGPLRAAACTYRIALGPRAGQKVLSLQTVPTQEGRLAPCAVSTSRALASMPRYAAPPMSATSWNIYPATSPAPPLPTND